MAFTTVTCAYTINCYGQRTPAQTAADMSSTNVPIPPEFLELTGATLVGGGSDITTTSGQSATRTIVFVVNTAQFEAQFPNNEISPFLGLMVGPIQAYTNQKVIEAEPFGT
jgi:hypothetical protein